MIFYSFIAAFFLSLINKKRAEAIVPLFSSVKVPIGGTVSVSVAELSRKKPFFTLPCILVRYEIRLETVDGRVLMTRFAPFLKNTKTVSFSPQERGAYYETHNACVVSDLGGFFVFKLFLSPKDMFLLAMPLPSEKFPVILNSFGGENRRQTGSRTRRADTLIDHRPYMPGDDPRRINWKLYGHSDGLFVREEEREPPPRSRLVILVDTHADGIGVKKTSAPSPAIERARQDIDTLCRYALTLAEEFSAQGTEVRLLWTGGQPISPTAPFQEALAYPFLIIPHPVDSGENYPPLSDDMAVGDVIILALPRKDTQNLDAFIKAYSARCGKIIVTYPTRI